MQSTRGIRDFTAGGGALRPVTEADVRPDRQGAGAVEMIFRIAENHFVTFKADPEGRGIEPNGIIPHGCGFRQEPETAAPAPISAPPCGMKPEAGHKYRKKPPFPADGKRGFTMTDGWITSARHLHGRRRSRRGAELRRRSRLHDRRRSHLPAARGAGLH